MEAATDDFMKPIVADSSPLISLFRINQVDLLPKLFERIFIPPAVAGEITHRDKPGGSFFASTAWLEEVNLTSTEFLKSVDHNLGSGERQAIALAHQLGLDVLIDDSDARKEAMKKQVSALGTIGLIAYAKQENLVPRVRPLMDDLIRNEFWISNQLYNQVLLQAGEQDADD